MAMVRQKVASIKKKVLFVKRINTEFRSRMPKNGITVAHKIVVTARGSALVTHSRIAQSSSMMEQAPGRVRPAGRGSSKEAARSKATAIRTAASRWDFLQLYGERMICIATNQF